MRQSTSIISCQISHLIQRCNERGYSLDEVKDCIVSQNGHTVEVDISHPSYPKFPKITSSISGGPGTELKKLLSKIGINATPTCSCNARAKKMDEWGSDECENRIDEIVGWLREESNKRHLPFIDSAGRLLIKRAIYNARKSITKNKK